MIKLSTVVFLICASFSTAAFPKIEEVYERESVANRMAISLEQYEQARDSYFLGDAGFLDTVKNFQREASAWLEAWRSFNLELKNWKGRTSLEEIEIKTVLFLREQQQKLSDLGGLAENISRIGDRSALTLIQGSELPTNSDVFLSEAQGLGGAREELTKSRVQLNDAMLQVIKNFNEMNLAYGQDFLLSGLREAAVNTGVQNIDSAMFNVEQLIRTEITGGPIVEKVKIMANEINQEAFDLHFYRLKKLIPAFNDECAKADIKLNALDAASAYKNSLLSNLHATCDEAKHRVEDLGSNYTPQEIAVSMHKRNIKRFKNVCRTPNSKYECDIYAWLSGLTEKDIQSYSDGSLALLEETWRKISKLD